MEEKLRAGSPGPAMDSVQITNDDPLTKPATRRAFSLQRKDKT